MALPETNPRIRARATLAAVMDISRGHAWARTAILAGVLYFLIGRLFALPTDHVRAWRWAAWLVSAVVYAVHIRHEARRNRAGVAAWHVAAAVGLGAFGLAVAGMMHAAVIRPRWFFALVLWPAFTATPAFVGALLAASLLRLRAGR